MALGDIETDRRLQRAIQHTSQHWFPINPEVLYSIREGLDSGAFELDLTFLITSLKQDFALFTYCIKELLPIATRQGASSQICSDPIQLLRWAGVARIKSILGSDRQTPSTHSLDRCEPFLVHRLTETGLAASAAQVLATARELDGDTVFCHGVVRQIGLNLVAWNYPSVYSRVIRSLSSSATLDDALAQELGFSPALLAMRFFRPTIDETSADGRKIVTTWATYDTLYSVGEALTRANSPDIYPTAERDWTQAQKFLDRSLGPQGIELIKKRTLENTAIYQRELTELFTQISSFAPEEKVKRYRKGLRSKDNQYLKYCPPLLQSALEALYGEMPSGEVSKLAIEKLVKQLFPQAGFTGGCVYVIDPTSMTLAPRVSFGKLALRTLRALPLQADAGRAIGPLVSEVITTHMRSAKDLALAALACDQPLVERSNSESDTAVGALCGVIGKKRKVGVMYLELPEKTLDKDNQLTLNIFKALRQTLCDALLVD
jgi:hypothetical protein